MDEGISEMNIKLEEFIVKRCSYETCKRIKEDRIDESVIVIMTDGEIERYIPHYGDRLAVVAFAKQLTLETEIGIPFLERKNVIDRMRDRSLSKKQRTGLTCLNQHDARALPQIGNASARKKQRRLEIGWLDFSKDTYKQVKAPSGGGVRHLVLPEDVVMADVQEEAKKLFFPNGISKKGVLQLYSCHICDFSQAKLSLTKTLRDMYNETKVKLLRLYLATKEHDIVDASDDTSRTRVAPPIYTSRCETATQQIGSASCNVVDTSDNTTRGRLASRVTTQLYKSRCETVTQQIDSASCNVVDTSDKTTRSHVASRVATPLCKSQCETVTQQIDSASCNVVDTSDKTTRSHVASRVATPLCKSQCETATQQIDSASCNVVDTSDNTTRSHVASRVATPLCKSQCETVPQQIDSASCNVVDTSDKTTRSHVASRVATPLCKSQCETVTQQIDSASCNVVDTSDNATRSHVASRVATPLCTSQCETSTHKIDSAFCMDAGAMENDIQHLPNSSPCENPQFDNEFLNNIDFFGSAFENKEQDDSFSFDTTTTDFEVLFGPSTSSDSGLNETLPLSQDANIENITLHRGHVKDELIQYFIHHDPDIKKSRFEITMILPNGRMEQGEDSGGVLRDALAEFWNTFYEMCTLGETVKVPVLLHTMTRAHWEACAKVLVMGFYQVKYFPIQISCCFMKRALKLMATNCEIIQDFLNYMPEMEREVMKRAIENFESVDLNEIVYALESYNVRTCITKESLSNVLEELANKHIVQEATFVSECWRDILLRDLEPILTTDIDSMYMNLTPTTKKVLDILTFPADMTTTQSMVAGYLKKFLKGCSLDMLKKYLRFCTGSDLLLSTNIEILFVIPSSGFARSPVSHTCGCVLEMPETYETYQELRQEFNNILQSEIWVMDFI